MPFLDEQELAALRQEIHDANERNEELENEMNEKIEKLEDAKYAARNRNIVLSVLLGVAGALAYYFYSNKTVNNVNIAEIKKAEAERVIDSIGELQLANNNNNDDDYEEGDEEFSVEEGAAAISNQMDGETIYSVQIGVFTKKKHPLLSETFTGTVSKGNLFKYSVGLFKTLPEAQKFRKELVDIGFDDAFVASYINGVRQQIHQPN
ncbi:hypothetical protein [Tenacibaculum sp. IB213877]|uniref:hypothetical protein n=1 Tax=Tenacibaculum sp. IB213877 TaxID=3097351 RepID=UPI002A59E4AD|nr:hypothetical protein [Tenacibaculum sp. IB213877]MDY0779460.1 hypothetical protein [Tenacibaculum sp. IB213877]